MTQTLEALMMASFGISWPISIIKSLKAKSTKGKSVIFLFCIDFGYICGVTWKIQEWISSGKFSYPIIIYAINLAMVIIDTMLYFRNRKLEREASAATQPESVKK